MRWELMDLLKQALKRFDIGILKQSHLQQLIELSRGASDLELIATMPDDSAMRALRLLPRSKSQLRQDLFVLWQSGFKTNGFFVEFGATNGVDLSNTYLLEREFGWQGILAEPATCWHQKLRLSRTSKIDTRCVWTQSDAILTFNEVDAAELSTIALRGPGDLHQQTRKRRGRRYDVTTVSLRDLLREHDAPRDIDYLSIDTEGSEYEILNGFDFGEYRFRVITCEHNFTAARGKIFDLLSSRGYVRKFEQLSQFDDWYVLP
jgi:FkbM family methyltransferase